MRFPRSAHWWSARRAAVASSNLHHPGGLAEGSATAVALQVNILNASCSGEFALVPGGSTRTDRVGSFAAGENAENFDLVELPASGQLTLRLLGAAARWASSSGCVATTVRRLEHARRQLDADRYQAARHYGRHGGRWLNAQQRVGLIPSTGVSGIAAEVVTANAS